MTYVFTHLRNQAVCRPAPGFAKVRYKVYRFPQFIYAFGSVLTGAHILKKIFKIEHHTKIYICIYLKQFRLTPISNQII